MSSVSGTTRDAVDTELVAADGQRFNLIDTAGIRKRAAVTESRDGAEPLSVQRAIQAVRRAQVNLGRTAFLQASLECWASCMPFEVAS